MTHRQNWKFRRNLARTLFLLFLAVVCGVFFYREQQRQKRLVSLENFQEASVVWLIDGDTLDVMVDGKRERVRLIGIDCEESVLKEEARNTEKGKQEAAFVKELLSPGDLVYLQRDVTERDRYDRLLRYVWIELPADPLDLGEVRKKMLNGILVDQMETSLMDFPSDVGYSEIFHQIREEG